jgi:hypothetical protein
MKRLGFVLLLSLVCAAYAVQAFGQKAFSAAGEIESTSGGFKFPDGSVQTTAATQNHGSYLVTVVAYALPDDTSVNIGLACYQGDVPLSIGFPNQFLFPDYVSYSNFIPDSVDVGDLRAGYNIQAMVYQGESMLVPFDARLICMDVGAPKPTIDTVLPVAFGDCLSDDQMTFRCAPDLP